MNACVLSLHILLVTVSLHAQQTGPQGTIHPPVSFLTAPGVSGSGYPEEPAQPMRETAWRMTTALYENWVTDGWQSGTRATYTYEDDLLHQVVYQAWSGGMWTNSSRYTYSYDDEERNTQLLLEQWTGGAWQNSQLTTNTYAGSDLSQALVRIWSGSSWSNSSLSTYTYQSGHLHQVLFQTWTAMDGWNDSYLYTYTYQGEDLSEILVQTWSGTAWVNTSLTTYTYSEGRIFQVLTRTWSGGAWQNSTLSDYSYSGDLLSEVLYRTWQSGSWQNWYHYDYSYDGYGNNTQIIGRTWSGGSWVNAVRSTYTWESYQGIEGSGAGMIASLGDPFPNPSTGMVTATLVLHAPGDVRAGIYDIRGDRIACILDGARPAGEIELSWDGSAPAGVYLLRVTAAGEYFTGRIILNK